MATPSRRVSVLYRACPRMTGCWCGSAFRTWIVRPVGEPSGQCPCHEHDAADDHDEEQHAADSRVTDRLGHLVQKQCKADEPRELSEDSAHKKILRPDVRGTGHCVENRKWRHR